MKEAAGEVIAFGIMESKFGKADELMELLTEELIETWKLDGVRDAYISQSMDEPNHFFTYSRWESLAAYDLMQAQLAGREEKASLTELLAGPPLWGSYMIV